MAAFLLLTLGCSASSLLQPGQATPAAAIATRTLAPTFTPTPEVLQAIVIVTPPLEGTPGVIIIPEGMDPSAFIVPPATATPTPEPATATSEAGVTPAPGETVGAQEAPIGAPAGATPVIEPPTATPSSTATPIPSDTPTPTFTPSPSITPTPYIVVESGYVALRSGPGVEYPLTAQLGPAIPISIIGRSTDGGWFQLCCVNGNAVWVDANAVTVVNDVNGIALTTASGPPPTATWTPTPTWTPTVTPTPTATPYPFQRTIGPQFFPTNNEFLTIWAKIHIGVPPSEVPAEGYFVRVLFEGFDRPNTKGEAPSSGVFEFSGPAGAGNRVQYNYKYEYRPPDPKSIDPNSTATMAQFLGTGTWTIYVADGAGRQLSDAITFTTAPSNVNREVYVGWQRVR